MGEHFVGEHFVNEHFANEHFVNEHFILPADFDPAAELAGPAPAVPPPAVPAYIVHAVHADAPAPAEEPAHAAAHAAAPAAAPAEEPAEEPADRATRVLLDEFCDTLNNEHTIDIVDQIIGMLVANPRIMALSYVDEYGVTVDVKNFIARGRCAIASLQLLVGAAALPPDDRADVLYDTLGYMPSMPDDARNRCITIIRLLLGVDNHNRGPRIGDDLEGLDPLDPTAVLIPNDCAIPPDVLRNYRRDGNSLFTAFCQSSRDVINSDAILGKLMEVCDVNAPTRTGNGRLPEPAIFDLVSRGRLILDHLHHVDWTVTTPNYHNCNALMFALRTMCIADELSTRNNILSALDSAIHGAPQLLERDVADARGFNVHDYIAMHHLDVYATCVAFYREDFVCPRAQDLRRLMTLMGMA
jgi:hypothetical protein